MTHPTTDRLYEALGPGITHGDDGSLRLWLDGPGSLLGEVDEMVREDERGIGWAREFDPARTHNPRWLAQFVGVAAPQMADDDEVRALIVARPAFRRGTPQSLIEAVAVTLTGTRTVLLTERDGGAYLLTVTTYDEETPDPAATEAAARAAKPAGLLLTYTTVPLVSYASLEAEAPQTSASLEAEAPQTYADLEAT